MSLSSLHEATGRTRKLGRALSRAKEARTTAQASDRDSANFAVKTSFGRVLISRSDLYGDVV
jgi:hypothetical protein